MGNLKRIIIQVIIASCFQFLVALDKILNLKKPEREKWFTELGFGMFIHWSFDVQIGMVIIHNMVDASDEYLDK